MTAPRKPTIRSRNASLRVVVAIAVLCATVTAAWFWGDRLTAEEESLVGRWYASETDAGEWRHATLVEFSRKRHASRTRGDYKLIPNTGSTESMGVAAKWESQFSQLWNGRWRFRNGRLTIDDFPENSFWDRLVRFAKERRWSRASDDSTFAGVIQVSPDVICMGGGPYFVWYVRVPDDFEWPPTPMTPEEALAWHRAKAK